MKTTIEILDQIKKTWSKFTWENRDMPTATWQEIVEAGYKFSCANSKGEVTMTRNGYIEVFREVSQ